MLAQPGQGRANVRWQILRVQRDDRYYDVDPPAGPLIGPQGSKYPPYSKSVRTNAPIALPRVRKLAQSALFPSTPRPCTSGNSAVPSWHEVLDFIK